MHFQISGLIPISGGACLLLFAYRVIPGKVKNPEALELWHRKFGKFTKILTPVLVVFGFLELFGVMDTGYDSHQKYKSPYAREFADAADQLNKAPAGIQRFEEFISRLKIMEAHPEMPADLKQALNDYVTASQEGIAAMKAGRDTKPYDDRMTDSKKRILILLQK